MKIIKRDEILFFSILNKKELSGTNLTALFYLTRQHNLSRISKEINLF